MKKLSLALLIGTTALFIGCGGGSSSEEGSYEVLKSTSITASDAYVVKLNTPAVAVCGDQNYTTTEVTDGQVTFELPDTVDPSTCTYVIPDDAIVDTDGDGNYSTGDLPTRMGLTLQGLGVANPITTAAMEKNDTQTLEQARNFDPVQAKLQLLQDVNNTEYQTMVALSDTIADLVQQAKNQGISTKELLQNIDLEAAIQSTQNPDVNVTEAVTNAVLPAVSGTPLEENVTQIVQKTQEELKLIEELHNHVAEGTIDHETALQLIIAASDGDVNVTLDENTTKEQMEQIIEQVKNELEIKHNEMIRETNTISDDVEENMDNTVDINDDNTSENMDQNADIEENTQNMLTDMISDSQEEMTNSNDDSSSDSDNNTDSNEDSNEK
jgi:hypothetical protein